jgi:DNA-binding GntR family transcriptional regulator
MMHNASMETTATLDPISPAARGALRHQVLRGLLREIFQGGLPAGTRLMVMKLAQRFGTSSTPVREALVELEAIGVVEFVHNRGAVVAPFGPDALGEIYCLRRILETEAARSASGRVDAGTLGSLQREMVGLLAESDGPDWSQRASGADLRLHRLIATGCENARLAKEIRRYDTLVQTIREIIGNNRQAQQRALTEHLAIIAALQIGDATAAAAAMARHVQSSAQVAEAAMFSGR